MSQLNQFLCLIHAFLKLNATKLLVILRNKQSNQHNRLKTLNIMAFFSLIFPDSKEKCSMTAPLCEREERRGKIGEMRGSGEMREEMRKR